MKRFLIIAPLCLVLAPYVQAQTASEGHAVVSHGFETSDSIRFGILEQYDVGQYVGPGVDSTCDSLGANVSENWYGVPLSKPFFDHQRAICSGGWGTSSIDSNLLNIAWKIRQRVYTPSPKPIQGDELRE